MSTTKGRSRRFFIFTRVQFRHMEANPNQGEQFLHSGETVTPDIQSRVLGLLELPQDEFAASTESFVSSRMQELSTVPSLGSFSLLSSEPVKDFIQPETAMVASVLLSKPYHLDDPKAYEASFNWVKQLYARKFAVSSEVEPEKALLNAAVEAVQIGQVQYFGSYVGDAQKRAMAVADILDDDASDSESVACFGSSAMCLERASVAHNTLKILGIDSSLVHGTVSDLSEDGTTISSEVHAWVVLRTPTGKRVQFDPTNPILHKNDAGAITWCGPNLKTLDEDTFKGVDVILHEAHTNPDGTQELVKTHQLHYTYGTDPV